MNRILLATTLLLAPCIAKAGEADEVITWGGAIPSNTVNTDKTMDPNIVADDAIAKKIDETRLPKDAPASKSKYILGKPWTVVGRIWFADYSQGWSWDEPTTGSYEFPSPTVDKDYGDFNSKRPFIQLYMSGTYDPYILFLSIGNGEWETQKSYSWATYKMNIMRNELSLGVSRSRNDHLKLIGNMRFMGVNSKENIYENGYSKPNYSEENAYIVGPEISAQYSGNVGDSLFGYSLSAGAGGYIFLIDYSAYAHRTQKINSDKWIYDGNGTGYGYGYNIESSISYPILAGLVRAGYRIQCVKSDDIEVDTTATLSSTGHSEPAALRMTGFDDRFSGLFIDYTYMF